MLVVLAQAEPWRWQPHPEVWLLIAGILGLGLYATRVIGPKVVPAGSPAVSCRQKACFFLGLVLLEFAADWPLHDIGEQYLYSAHMIQHLLIAFVIPPLFLLATPEWLARLVILDDSRAARVIRKLARPIPAAVSFNAVTVFLHWPAVVTRSVENGPFHYSMHLLLFSTALLMWMAVAGPLPELRLSLPAQMIYLFAQSIIPTIPGGWLTFAENPVYKVYDRPVRLWNIGVIDDQQAAGAIMKILGGFYLWAIITVLFFRWAAKQEKLNARRDVGPVRPSADQPAGAVVADDEAVLTFEEVAAEFDRLGPAPRERVPGTPEQPPDDTAAN
jgi:putative membrane protein